MTTISKRLLLFFIIICSIVVLVVTVRKPIPAANQPLTDNSIHYVKKQVPQGTTLDVFGSKATSAKPHGNAAQVFFLASRQSGTIGLYGDNQTDNPVDNIFTVRIDEVLSENDVVWLTYRLTGVQDFSNVACCINDRLAFGGCQVKATNSTKTQRILVSPLWLTKGVNRIQFGLPENAAFGYKVSDLSIEVLKKGADSPFNVQTSQLSYNGKVYVHGFTTKGALSSIQANGARVTVHDNEFEALVPVKASGLVLTAMIDGKQYSKHIAVTGDIKADTVYSINKNVARQSHTFVKGKAGQLHLNSAALLVAKDAIKETQRLSLTSLRSVDIPALDLGLANVTGDNAGFRFLPHGEHFEKAATVAMKYDRTKIPDGYTENDIKTFYFDATTKHWVALERDSVNNALCMVYSKTTHFTDMINGVIKVPESPETQGIVPTMMNDIKAANPTSKIEIMAPPTANNMGSANLSYPLEMPPLSNSINPNLAIQYNSDGGSGWLGDGWDLNTPSITVDTRWGVPRFDPIYETETYSLGGVTLATVVDKNATDSLGFAFVAHKGVLYQRLIGQDNAGVQFHPVTENNFSLIVRYKDTPGEYYWKVATKDGITSTYGEQSNNAALSGLVNTFQYENTTSKKKEQTSKTPIAEWRLSSVTDQYRNFCRYYYAIDTFHIYGSNTYAKNIRLTQIKIGRSKNSGNNDVDTLYQVVDFIQKTTRQKRTTNARYGFLTSTSSKLLDSVRISQYDPNAPNGTPIHVRSYAFSYLVGAFNTQLLNKIDQCDDLNSLVASHVLSYCNNTTTNSYFQAEDTVNTTSVQDEHDNNALEATTKGLPALGGTKSESSSFSFNVGAGVGFGWGSAQMGYNYSNSKTESDTKMMMIDINGDGLPDKLYKGGQADAEYLCFIPNLGNGQNGQNGQFASYGTRINGYQGNFSNSTSKSNTNGWSGDVKLGSNKANVTVNVGVDWLNSSSKTPTYLSDVNSDGLIDIVNNGKVYFNSIASYTNEGAAIPTFSTNSGISPRPIINIKSIRGKAGVLKLSDLYQQTPNPTAYEQLIDTSEEPLQRDSTLVLEEKIEDYDQVPMQDIVRFWEAPRSGTIHIHSDIKYLGDPSAIGTDGVRLAIQTEGIERWCDSIKPTDAELERHLYHSTFEVTAGQRIYFRLQSGSNYFSDGLEDVVVWNQQISYNATAYNTYDQDGYPDWYNSTEGSFVSQQFDNKLDSVDEGSHFYIKGNFYKPVTNSSVVLKMYVSRDSLFSRDSVATEVYTDSLTQTTDTAQITYKIWYPNPTYYPEEMVWTRTFGKEEVTEDDLFPFDYSTIDSTMYIRFELSSNTNLPWDKIKWKPTIQYTRLSGKDTVFYAGVKYNVFEKKDQEGEGNNELFDNIDVYNKRVIPTIGINSQQVVNTNYSLVLYRMEVLRVIHIIPVATFYGNITNNVGEIGNFVVDTLPPGPYFFSIYINDTISPDCVTATCYFQNYNPSTVFTPNIYCRQPASRTILGHLWRGWGQFQYNAGNGRYAKPIEEDSLFLSETTQQLTADNKEGKDRCLYTMTHKQYKDTYSWSGTNDYLFISGDTMCAGRLNDGEMPALFLPEIVTLNQSMQNSVAASRLMSSPAASSPAQTLTGAVYAITNAPILSSRSNATTAWGGASANLEGVGSLGANYAKSTGDTKITSAYMDMNGDGFPDYITDNKIEFTNANGGRDGEVTTIVAESSNNDSESFGFSGTYTASSSSSTSIGLNLAKDLKVKSGSYSQSTNKTAPTTSYIDLNGDGLSDRLYISNSKVFVCLNLGYGFSSPIDWGMTQISLTKSSSISLGVSSGLSSDGVLNSIISGGGKVGAKALKWAKKLNLGVSAGVSHVGSTNYSLFNLFDVNMDGLPDKIYKNGSRVAVAFNLGTGFTQGITMEEIEEFYKSYSSTMGANLAISININLVFLRLSLGAAGNLGWATEYTLNQMMDIDGDGFSDVVKASDNPLYLAQLKVKRSKIGCTNKLCAVSNPFGGTIRLNYTRTQASYDHPGGKWVMSTLSVNDGVAGDGDSLVNKFTYSGGKYDRYEREFLGYSDVITENINTQSASRPTYRKTHQTFDNANYYTRGSLLSSELIGVEGSAEKTFAKTTNSYHTYSVLRVAHSSDATKLGKYSLKEIQSDTELTPVNRFLYQYIIYNPLKFTQDAAYAYTGSTQSSLVTSQSYFDYYTYSGTHGEISGYKFSDKGGLSADGTGTYNYKTNINYLRDISSMTLFALPTEMTVTGSDGKVYRKTKAVWNDNFASQLHFVKQAIASGDTAITQIDYDQWGNIAQKLLPGKVENNQNNRMWYTYTYDSFYHLFPTEASSRFGYKSRMGDYNYKYGIPCRTTDINGSVILTTLDHLGRVTSVKGPNEVASGKPYTLQFTYPTQTPGSPGRFTAPAYAVTNHYDECNPTNALQTVTFADGFGRAIQVKKDGYVGTAEVSLVSGRVKYDPYGRAVRAFYPMTEHINNKLVFNPDSDATAPPTTTTYDVLDRVTSQKTPDGFTTSTSYGIITADKQLKTTLTDAKGGTQATFTNGSGLTSKTEQYSGPDDTITTLFAYDAINQPISVTDAKGKLTVSVYDLAGRRIKLTHPASGITTFRYDQAGNLVSKQTANLAQSDDSITYTYKYNRLEAINYPLHPENNVTYTYGVAADSTSARGYRAGRLKYLIDGSGAQEFKYGRMGEVTEERRTLVIPNQAVATYVTKWTYDSWNRVRTMTYPDGESLAYSYNVGGLLSSLSGTKGGYTYPYVKSITYDKFEQRTSIKYGNDAVTNYTYNASSRNLSGLLVISTNLSGLQLMNNAYAYDDVDNVMSVTNSAPIPASGIGGNITHTYTYDGLYRLKDAHGTYTGAGQRTASYDLTMSYDNLHNITAKTQNLIQNNVQFTGTLKVGYGLNYTYNPANNQQLTSLADTSYRTTGTIVKTGKRQDYTYDASGNLLSVYTTRRESTGRENLLSARRLLWDEENRLLAVSDNGYVSNYWYDASGERTVKQTADGEGVLVNDRVSGARTGTSTYTVYVNPYTVITNGGQMSKHIYIGSQRILSQLCSSGSVGGSVYSPLTITKATGTTVNYTTKYATLTAKVKTRYDSLDVPYHGKDNAGVGYWSYASAKNETDQYYFHSDHLGSSSLITNLAGAIVQHIEYVPFGEVFLEERTATWGTPYKFNAKELDEETGLYYYTHRYYDPRISLWLSVDPLAGKYPNVSSYVYCKNNPVNRIDPTGKIDYKVSKMGFFYQKSPLIDKVKNFFGIKDKNDRIMLEGSNKVISILPAGSIGKIDRNDKKLTQFEIKNNGVAEKVFKDLAKNSDVEWARVSHSTKNSSSNTLVNQHSYEDVSAAAGIALNYKNSGQRINLLEHSHPIPPYFDNVPSFNMNTPVSNDDIYTAGKFPNTTQRVLNVSTNQYENYDSNGVYKKTNIYK